MFVICCIAITTTSDAAVTLGELQISKQGEQVKRIEDLIGNEHDMLKRSGVNVTFVDGIVSLKVPMSLGPDQLQQLELSIVKLIKNIPLRFVLLRYGPSLAQDAQPNTQALITIIEKQTPLLIRSVDKHQQQFDIQFFTTVSSREP